MLSRFHRNILYAAVIFAMAIVGAAINYPQVELHWSAAFAILTLIFFAMVELHLSLTKARETPLVEVIYGEDELKKVYKSMRGNRDCVRMSTIWCTQYADTPKYFKEERGDFRRNDRLHIRRLINPDRVNPTKPRDFENHVKDTNDLVKQGRYEIATTDLEELECVICEYESRATREHKALFVFNEQPNNTPRLGILLDPTRSVRHERIMFAVEALRSWFEREWARAGSIVPLEE